MKKILALSNAKALAEKIAQKQNLEFVKYETRKFPDGETYFRIDTPLKNSEVVLVQSGFPEPDNAFMELLLAIDSCKAQKAKSITAVIPYFFYARQDKRFKTGEAFSLEVISKVLKNAGIKKVVVFDMHRCEVGEFEVGGLKFENFTAGSLLAEFVKEKFSLQNLVITAPDFGASKFVENAAKKTGSEFGILEKKRSSDYEVSVAGNSNVKGKNVLVLDDIISTGNTMLRVIEKVKSSGALKVFAGATHGLFVENSLQKLKNVVDYLVTTDSVENETSEVSLSGLL